MSASKNIGDKRKPKTPSVAGIPSLVATLLDGIPCPPTDLAAVATRLDAEIVYERISGSGELRQAPQGWQIVCNPILPTSRCRFTIAHEIGHVLLANAGWEGKQEGKAAERFCDVVAAELLMPTPVFRQDLQQELSIPLLRQLQERYGSSLQATAYRCAELGKTTVVEARAGKVVRARGPLRNFTGLDDEQLRQLVKQACNGVTGSTRIYLNHNHSVRLWNVLYHALQRREQALLLINPVKE
jgi:hypothetical protein